MSSNSNVQLPALSDLLSVQRAAFLKDGPPDAHKRKADLAKLKEALLSNREAFVKALNDDFGNRPRQETTLFDLGTTVGSITYLSRNLGRWMKPERRSTGMAFAPATNKVIYQPLGVVGIISPWNYPVALAVIPLATALAAGNRAMIKPSELTPRTTELLQAVLAKAFQIDQVAVVTGPADVGIAFSRLAFDHLLFTGSTPVGKAIMHAASENLVPVTLELGGKSPVVVAEGSNLQVAARRTAHGKLVNSGQTCTGPDYVLVSERDEAAFVREFQAASSKLYPNILENRDYASVINDHHYARLEGLIDDAKSKGAEIVEIQSSRGTRKTHPRTMMPKLIRKVTDEMAVMNQEIFGPILPIVTYRTLEEAIAYVNARPRPLALYYFGPNDERRAKVLARTTSGGVSINETNIHYAQKDLPFGGVGGSGMGAYHGREGFKTMSHAKAVFQQSKINFTDNVRPPFGRVFDMVTGFLVR